MGVGFLSRLSSHRYSRHVRTMGGGVQSLSLGIDTGLKSFGSGVTFVQSRLRCSKCVVSGTLRKNLNTFPAVCKCLVDWGQEGENRGNSNPLFDCLLVIFSLQLRLRGASLQPQVKHSGAFYHYKFNVRRASTKMRKKGGMVGVLFIIFMNLYCKGFLVTLQLLFQPSSL